MKNITMVSLHQTTIVLMQSVMIMIMLWLVEHKLTEVPYQPQVLKFGVAALVFSLFILGIRITTDPTTPSLLKAAAAFVYPFTVWYVVFSGLLSIFST